MNAVCLDTSPHLGILFYCVSHRDEIYCQICKQLMNNKDRASRMQGWALLSICLGIFPPTDLFIKVGFCHFSFLKLHCGWTLTEKAMLNKLSTKAVFTPHVPLQSVRSLSFKKKIPVNRQQNRRPSVPIASVLLSSFVTPACST